MLSLLLIYQRVKLINLSIYHWGAREPHREERPSPTRCRCRRASWLTWLNTATSGSNGTARNRGECGVVFVVAVHPDQFLPACWLTGHRTVQCMCARVYVMIALINLMISIFDCDRLIDTLPSGIHMQCLSSRCWPAGERERIRAVGGRWPRRIMRDHTFPHIRPMP